MRWRRAHRTAVTPCSPAFQGTLVAGLLVYSKRPFDAVEDFAPITNLGDGRLMLATHPTLAANVIYGNSLS